MMIHVIDVAQFHWKMGRLIIILLDKAIDIKFVLSV